MNNFKAWKYEPVEISIPSGTTQTTFTFPNQSSLYNKIIKAVEVYTFTAMPVSPLTGGATIVNADFIKGFIEFFDGSTQQVNRIPLPVLNRLQDSATNPFARDLFQVDDWVITWDKCKLDFWAVPSTTGVVVTLGVYYIDMPDGWQRKIY